MNKEDSETAYKRALERKEDLEAELREINMFLSVYLRFTSTAGDHTTPSPAEVGRAPTLSQAEFVERATKFMLEYGKPMTHGQLLVVFKAAGRPIAGDSAKNLKTKLWRASGKIARIPGAGYWPKDVACPAIGYNPSTESEQE